MDFRFSEEEENFRKEVREFLERELPEGWVEKGMIAGYWESVEGGWALGREMQRKLAAKGWLSLGWPVEYGGQPDSYIKYTILREEVAYYRAPGIDTMGVRLLSSPLIMYGTEEQKRKHLGTIARGEVIWCEGFSEPDTGSDLASLQTSAVEDGDYYIINGHKIWTTNAHHADWIFLLARTDPRAMPKHKGLSFFLIDMKTPGISMRPIINMAGLHDFNEVFFDNVRVPKENLVGEKNRGWYVAMALLVFERAAIETIAACRRMLEQLVEYVKENKTLAKDPIVRQKLAQMSIEIEVSRLITYHIVWMQSKGLVPDYEASVQKLFRMELQRRLAGVGLQVLGLYGQLKAGSKWAPLMGGIERLYLMSIGLLTGAGTPEIQRSVIATRGLGLPRE